VGALVALALVVGIWVFTGRSTDVQGQAMGEVNRPAPTFSLQTLKGDTVDLKAYQGKVVLLNFWGTWCEPCKRELPALQVANERLGDQGLVIIGVNLTDDERLQGRSEEDIRTFVAQYNLTYPIALDRNGSVTDAFRVFPLPTSFFIDAQGRIRYVHVGELTLKDVTARFTELQREGLAPGAP
jgi:cytochrome c biogenesis protein CcmG, thiol:disulfide interchange protein DsbE